MKILVTGRGTSGSWAIRGVQLGEAIGATVLPRPEQIPPCDLAIIVKRTPPGLLAQLHAQGVPLVWDIVDAWPQPFGNSWNRPLCMHWLRSEVARIKPRALVAATQAMLADCAEFGLPVLHLPHHAKPGQRVNPIRETVRRVGYQGSRRYIEIWGNFMAAECARRGWAWEPEAVDLADLDIVVAVRDQYGYAPRQWKSAVKLANAQSTGTPIICCREAGYLERPNGLVFADTFDEMCNVALDALAPHDARAKASAELLRNVPLLADIAKTYKDWLHALRL